MITDFLIKLEDDRDFLENISENPQNNNLFLP